MMDEAELPLIESWKMTKAGRPPRPAMKVVGRHPLRWMVGNSGSARPLCLCKPME